MKFGRHFASSLGKFRISVAKSERELSAIEISDHAMDRKKLEQIFLMQAKPVEKHANEIRNLLHPLQGDSTLIMRERSADNPRKTHLHHRGEYTQPKHEVQPRLPEAIFADFQSPPKNRIEFAKWLVSRDNPLTARVVANRQWAAFFGTGIVKTVADFGMQGESPSHPELLDFLAVELMDKGLSLIHI